MLTTTGGKNIKEMYKCVCIYIYVCVCVCVYIYIITYHYVVKKLMLISLSIYPTLGAWII